MVVPGFSRGRRPANAFKESLWPQLRTDVDDLTILEALIYESNEATVKNLSDYSGKLSRKIERESPDAIIASDIGGMILIAAMGILRRNGNPWTGKVAFIDVPFNGASELRLSLVGFPVRAPPLRDIFRKHKTWQEFFNSLPVRTPALLDILEGSSFLQGLDFSVLNGCQTLCLSGLFSRSYLGLAGWLARPVMDPSKKLAAVGNQCTFEQYDFNHDDMLRHELVGQRVKDFVINVATA
jgi:hypothetical protein